jgi:hypothetical protein
MMAVVGPRTVCTQSDTSSALETVADRHTRVTSMDDDLLPHRAPIAVLEVVHLVEHDRPEGVERRRPGVDHVAQHLGGHHDDRCVAVDGVVAGEQAHPHCPVPLHELAVLLVGQGLERCRVERFSSLGQGLGHRVLPHHRLSRPGRRGDEDRPPGVERIEGGALEDVERERVSTLEPGADVAFRAHFLSRRPMRMEPS